MPHQTVSVGEYHAGDTLVITATVRDETGTALDIANASEIEWYLKSKASDLDSEALLSKTLTGGGITYTTDGTDGKFDIDIETGDTSDLLGTKHHRARVIDGDGDRSTIFTGDFTISQ